MSTRPRPRPRPVAKSRESESKSAKPTSAVINPAESSSSAGQSSSSSNVQANNIDDDDAFFMRNRGRTAQHWKKLHQLTKGEYPQFFSNAPVSSPEAPEEDEDEWGEPTIESSPRQRKKKPSKQLEVPRWQASDITTLLSSDGDDDDLQIIEHTSANRKGADVSPKKRKRARSRSRSITPPPALSAAQLSNARNLVRQALDIGPRPVSPTQFADDSTDTIVLAPELAKIAETIRNQAPKENVAEQVGGPEAVMIKVRWRPHPLKDGAEKQVWAFKMKRHDTFRDLFEELADLATVLVDHLVVTCDGKRLFPSGTPHNLRIWAEGELEACDKPTYEYIRTQRHHRSLSPTTHDGDEHAGRSPSAAPHSGGESDAESTGGDKFKIILRSAVTKDKNINLIVRSTTTCGAIVQAFLKSAGLSNKYPSTAAKGKKSVPMPQLMIDGERMQPDTEISEADLDDGDLVEVVGL
ncbi:hypothetical protein BJ138DRAFT_1000474 [Hygrophoropsis aurantiaca]|uniref:Uncharacterized protein n=1 Tax=Hygrophoropsis aurantiaca TaxID=72124 RepID=A0ACB8AM11_9AGAM|nr:hypothetical protein BJ138DRAFT_1000474 [Hygrophoropsis aurantiaca]